MIRFQTNYGSFAIDLDFKNTPKTAENFLQHAKNGFYEGVIFHRIDGFILAGALTRICSKSKASCHS